METTIEEGRPVGIPVIMPPSTEYLSSVGGVQLPQLNEGYEATESTPTENVVSSGGNAVGTDQRGQPPKTINVSQSEFPDLAKREGYYFGNKGFQPVTKFIKHLIIKGDGFAKQNIFNRSKDISAALGSDKVKGLVMKVMTYDESEEKFLDVTVENAYQSERLLKTSKLGNFEVQVCKHDFKNHVFGVFYDMNRELETLPPSQVQEGIKEWNDNIVEVKRLGTGLSWKVTLECLEVPRRIQIGIGTSYRMETFVPLPLRCFKCQQYRHSAKKCRNNSRCSRCGDIYEGGHDFKKCNDPTMKCDCTHCYKVCKNPIKCVNCSGDHHSGDKDCPKQTVRKEINRLVYREGMAWKEAELRANANVQGQTFAKVANVTANPVIPVEHQRRTEDPGIAERMTKLETMFMNFLNNAANSKNQNGDAVTSQVAALQATVKKQHDDMEQLKRKFTEQAKKGNDVCEKLKMENKALQQDNSDLQQQYRDLMLSYKFEPSTVPKRSHTSSEEDPVETKSQKTENKTSKTKKTPIKFKDSSEASAKTSDTPKPNNLIPKKPLSPRGGGRGSGGEGSGTGRGGSGRGRRGGVTGGNQQ